MDTRTILSRAQAALAAAYGSRLAGVVLYGSAARGEDRPDSDVDLLVLLRGPVSLGADLARSISALYPLQLEVVRPLHPIPVDESEYKQGARAVYREAALEGVRV